MWIKTTVFLCCMVAALAADKQPPKKKEDPRGKRNLQYHIAHHTSPHAYRRISTAPQIPLYHSQFFPGPRSYSPYHQDGQNDLLTDNNHLSESVYGPQPQKHIIERPVYIKEPEPIIEIIIKESNVTLPPPPAPPTPPPKKREQVQVFYVKYKKNPNGHGKDSVIYDKPIPAISPPIHDEQEEAPPPVYHQEVVTRPPPPSTTLRTIIKPDSETYHSPSGVKVTFGKEGFDYEKRSSKAADLKVAEDDNKSVQFPQGRQLAAFPPRRPEIISFTPPPGYRQPQPYRPFSQQSQPTSHSFSRPSQQQYSTLPKFAQFQQPGKSVPRFPPARPAPPQFHRQPVPYQPFESLRQPQFRPETHFPITQAPPITQKPVAFNHRPQISETRPQIGESRPHIREPRPQISETRPQIGESRPQIGESRPQIGEPRPHIREPRPQISETRPHVGESKPHFTESRPQLKQKPQFQQPAGHQFQQQFSQYQQSVQPQVSQFHQPQPQQPHQFHQQQQHQQQQQRPAITQSNQYQFQQFQQALPLQHQQPQQFNPQPSIIPPGGELIHSVPKFEQHISVPGPLNTHQSQIQPQYQFQPQLQQSSIKLNSDTGDKNVQQKNNAQHHHTSQSQSQSQSQYQPQPSYDKIQQQLREANALQESIRSSSPQFYNFQQSQQHNYFQSSPKPSTYSPTTTTTTTTTTSKPSTTTKDPKVLNAQLPDEVPDDLREQLLSSGILNNADISVLDYDKVGDIPLSALPPDQLANFYSAGGAQQIQAAGSAPVPAFAERDFDTEGSEIHEVTAKPEVQMKVVRYDPESDRGQQVQEAYVKDDATQVDPVVLNDEKYNRYLPLKISGTQFPIPDVAELKGKKITSVVVLAPISYDFSASRPTREAKNEEIELLEGHLLKDLLKNPTKENFKKFLDNENQTSSDQQAVILLVAGSNEDAKDKEIFMYDIATKTVSKLDGELSSAFVDAAEANSADGEGDTKASASNIVETRVPYEVPIADTQADLEAHGSEHLESFVDASGIPVVDDLTASESRQDNKALGIRKTGRLS